MFNADIRCFAGEIPKKWLENEEVEWETYKHDSQSDFKDNKYTLLCATKAFGMGIDKPNVRYTVPYGIPSSLEALYQEAGRANHQRIRFPTVRARRDHVYDRRRIDRQAFAGEGGEVIWQPFCKTLPARSGLRSACMPCISYVSGIKTSMSCMKN